jgi:hypothetical protein
MTLPIPIGLSRSSTQGALIGRSRLRQVDEISAPWNIHSRAVPLLISTNSPSMINRLLPLTGVPTHQLNRVLAFALPSLLLNMLFRFLYFACSGSSKVSPRDAWFLGRAIKATAAFPS